MTWAQSESSWPERPTIPDYRTTAWVLYSRECEKLGVDPEDHTNPKVHSLSDDLYWHTFTNLMEYLNMLEPYQAEIILPEGINELKPSRDRESLNFQQRLDEDRDIIWGK
jgi:hypothetical protein